VGSANTSSIAFGILVRASALVVALPERAGKLTDGHLRAEHADELLPFGVDLGGVAHTASAYLA